jgi:hypothetical protein
LCDNPALSRIVTQLELSPEQQWFFQAGPQPTFLIGGMGAGKTWCGCLKVLHLADLYPKSNIAIVRRAYRQLRATTMTTFYQLCDPSWIADRNDTDGVCRLKNGSEIRFLHLDAENSLGVLASLELSAAYVDQVEEISDRAWDTLTARVGRCTRAVVPRDVVNQYTASTGRSWPWRLGTDNTGAPVPPRYIFAVGYATDEMHWLEERLSPKSESFAHWRERGYQRHIVDSRSNQRNLTKAYLADLLGRDEEFVRRYVRGESGNPEAHVFRLDPDSVLDPEPSFISHIKNTMILHRSLDHGESERSATACLWWATDGEGNIFCWQEYYQVGRVKGRDYNVSDFRRAITELSRGLTFRSNLADPAIFVMRRTLAHLDKHQRWSIADEYSDRRMIQEDTQLFWSPAENGEAVTRSRLREYLRPDPNHKHPITRQLGAPHLYFIRATTDYPHGCKFVLAEIRAARYVEISRQGDRPIYGDDRDENVPDHALDAARYFVVSRPGLAFPPGDPTKPALTMEENRVIMTVPKLDIKPPGAEYKHRGDWKSKAGGY